MPCPAGNDETAPVWEQTLRHKYNTQDLAARSNEASSIWSSRSSDPGETRGLDQGEHGVFQHGASMGIKSAKVVPLNDSHLLNSAKSGNVAQLHSQEQDDATRHKTSTEMRSAKVVPLKDSDMLDKTRSSGPPRVCLPDDDATAPTLHRRTRSSATDAGTQLREHGVTVHWLMEFFNRAKTHFKGRNNFTTREVVDGIVAPACRRHNMPYACMPTVEMKRAQTYISHTWEATFEELVFCVYQTFSGQPDAAVWIDFLALQQGGTDKERRDLDPASGGEGAARGRWSSGMSSEPERLDVVAELGGALLVLDRNAAALTDAWCLVESMAAASLRGLRIVPSLLNKESAKALSIRIGQLDINSAAAWPQSRTAAIQKFVQVRCGTGVSFNQVLRRQILECLPGIVLQCQQIHGRMSPEAAQAAELLAAVLKEYGELELATGLAATTLGILESLHGLNDPRVASTANNLANLWRLQGNLDAAQSLYSRAVASIESAESDSEALVHALLNLADTQKARGKLSEAAASYRKALACTGAGGTLRLLPAVLGLAHCLKATGDAPDAMQVLMEALNSLAQHPDKVPSSGNYEFQVLKSLGDVCKGAFDYARAEHYYERAVALKQECVASSPAPADELELATAMNGLASVLRLSGKHQRAEELYRQALAIREKHLPGDHPNIVSSTLHVAAVMKEHEAFESAAQMYRRALQVLEKTRGPMHLDVSSVLCNLATCLQETGNLKEAESLASRALRIRSAALGSEHAESVKALHVLESITSTQKSSQLL